MYSLDCPLHSKWIYQESDNMSLTVQYTVICIHFKQHVISHSWFLKNHQTETAKSKIYSFITLPNFSRFEFLHPLILNVVLSLECLELCNTVGDIRRVLRVQTSSPPPFFPKCTYQTRENNMFSNLMTTYFGAENWYHWIEISYKGMSCFIPHKILCSLEESLRLLAD